MKVEIKVLKSQIQKLAADYETGPGGLVKPTRVMTPAISD